MMNNIDNHLRHIDSIIHQYLAALFTIRTKDIYLSNRSYNLDGFYIYANPGHVKNPIFCLIAALFRLYQLLLFSLITPSIFLNKLSYICQLYSFLSNTITIPPKITTRLFSDSIINYFGSPFVS